MKAQESTALQTVVVAVQGGAAARPPWGEVSREVENLDAHARYEMWVKASTRVGEGVSSRVVSQAPSTTVAARIKSFGQEVEVKAGAPLTLPCSVVGIPAPLVTWTHLGRDAIPKSQKLPDHSLHLPVVASEASGNYTCHAHNPSGRDEARWSVRVVETPPPPTLRVQYSTETTIHLSWHTAGDGGKPITAPRQPRHQDLVSVNSSSVTLQLYTWPSGGCPITRWMVEYRAHSEAAFTAAASHLAGDTDSYTLADLSPLTWYQLRVTAHNTAGATAATYDVATASLTGATLAPESVVEVVDRRGSPLYLDPHILAPVVSGVACTLALLLCVGLLVSRGRAQFMKGGDGGGSGGGSSGGNTYSRSLAEIQNHHNDSQEQLSPPPGPRSKHDEAYSVDEPYEICPYATFSMPPGSNVPPGSAGRGTLDYTLQFHTFGHQECFEGQPAPQRAFAASLMGGRRRDGGCGSAAGASVEIACISSQQTLPISCVRAGGRRGGKKEVEEVEEGEVHGGSESEQDTSGSPGGVRGVPRDTYKVPVRLRRGADFSFHPPDSSTESNDERSPVPPRRPQHLPPTHPQHASHRLHACTPAPPPAQGLRPSSTLDSVYSVEGAVGGPLRPPTGFSDSSELSEAECDRDPGQGGHKGVPQQHGRRGFPPRPPTDYSIHV